MPKPVPTEPGKISTSPPPRIRPHGNLTRENLSFISNWSFRILAVIVGLFLLTQGSQWRGAYIYGLGFAAVSLGVFLTFRILQFPDLTIQGSFAAGGSVCAALIVNQPNSFLGNPWVASLAGMAFGGVAGFATGFLHTRLKINGLLAGIIVSVGLYSLNFRILGQNYLSMTSVDKPVTVLDQLALTFTGGSSVSSIDPVRSDFIKMAFFAIVAILLVVGLNWFLNTQLGLALRATGDNENMIRALGVNTDNAKILILVISNALVGLAGALLSQYLGEALVDMGADLIVVGLAAVILGEAFMPNHNILVALIGAVIGSLIYRLIYSSVYSLDLTLAIALHVVITAVVIAVVGYLVYLTFNQQTPAWLSLLCIAFGSVVSVFLSSFLYYFLVYAANINVEGTEVLKLAVSDVKIELAVLVVIAMGVPSIRRQLGLNKLKAAVSK